MSSLRVAALKQELESYGISTRAFLEKGELVEAVVRARREGQTPDGTASSSSGPAASAAPAGGAGAGSTAGPAADRTARLQIELEKCRPLTVAQLREELASYGISSATFFEKSEFVRAVAEARADGAPAARKSKKKKRRAAEEVEEVTAAKVEVITGDEGPRAKKARSADAGGGSPFGGGGSPFGGGGGGSPFGGGGGGMGGMDMGNIADMLKGMGGMGGGGGGNPFGGAAGGAGNPFGAAAGNPFGGAGGADPMAAAQQAMSNPKVMAVIQKAQKNPKVMAAVQECMGNPMAMGKYMSDPEVGPILKELQDAMR